jgi:threonine aldolase
MLCPAESNQIFPIFTNDKLAELRKNFDFYDWQKVSDEKTAVRLVCSWATSCGQAEAFIKAALS